MNRLRRAGGAIRRRAAWIGGVTFLGVLTWGVLEVGLDRVFLQGLLATFIGAVLGFLVALYIDRRQGTQEAEDERRRDAAAAEVRRQRDEAAAETQRKLNAEVEERARDREAATAKARRIAVLSHLRAELGRIRDQLLVPLRQTRNDAPSDRLVDVLEAGDPSAALATLRAVFTAPEELRPRIEPAQITEKAARHFAEIAQSLRSRGHDPEAVAHFLDRILFCLFAEDAGLLPKGIFSRLSQASKGRSDIFTNALGELFARMSTTGGLFGTEEIDWFNGGLFDSAEALPLTGSEIATLLEVSHLNWALIEPAIFGTLFERGLDPDQRAQLGAHYTDRDAIWDLVEPVILRPLRREYVAMQSRVTQLLLSGKKFTKSTPRD